MTKIKKCPSCDGELFLIDEMFIGGSLKRSTFYWECSVCGDEFTGKKTLSKRYIDYIPLDEKMEIIQNSGNAYNNFMMLKDFLDDELR
jgi:hypothetical protein